MFQEPQDENAILWAENTVLQAQDDQVQALSKKARPQTQVGNRMILTCNCMFSWQDAECNLVAKGLQIAQQQEQVSQRLNCYAAANNSIDDRDRDSVLTLLSPSASPPLPNLLDNLDVGEPLSTIENFDLSHLDLYNAVPQASSSCHQL